MKKWVSISMVFGAILLLTGCGFNFCNQTSGCGATYSSCNMGCNTGCSTVNYTSACASPCQRMNVCNSYDNWYDNDYY